MQNNLVNGTITRGSHTGMEHLTVHHKANMVTYLRTTNPREGLPHPISTCRTIKIPVGNQGPAIVQQNIPVCYTGKRALDQIKHHVYTRKGHGGRKVTLYPTIAPVPSRRIVNLMPALKLVRRYIKTQRRRCKTCVNVYPKALIPSGKRVRTTKRQG